MTVCRAPGTATVTECCVAEGGAWVMATLNTGRCRRTGSDREGACLAERALSIVVESSVDGRRRRGDTGTHRHGAEVLVGMDG
jgi:hypothetical protein